MQQMSRHLMIGPAVTIVLATIALVIQWYVVRTPAPAALPFMGVLFSAYVGGVAPGLISAGVTVLFGLAFNSQPDTLLTFSHEGVLRLVVLAMAVTSVTFVVGALQKREQLLLRDERRARQRAETMNRELMRLHAAFDRVDLGIVLLDDDLRAQFVNHAYQNLFDLSDGRISPGISFADLLRRVRKTKMLAMPAGEIEDYVARRLRQMHDRVETRVDLRLVSGQVVRAHSTPLPDGGWLLAYTDVTDLVSQADEMTQLATIDGMTELYNRRHFQSAGQDLFIRARQAQQPLSLMIVDIDHFKAINDRFGHAAGDDVLRHLAGLCRQHTGADDLVGRLGGDEIVILMPDTGLDRACACAERLREQVCAAPVPADGHPVSLTVSIGVAATTPGIRDLDALMKQADAALYEAKRNRRNQVVPAATRVNRIIAA